MTGLGMSARSGAPNNWTDPVMYPPPPSLIKQKGKLRKESRLHVVGNQTCVYKLPHVSSPAHEEFKLVTQGDAPSNFGMEILTVSASNY